MLCWFGTLIFTQDYAGSIPVSDAASPRGLMVLDTWFSANVVAGSNPVEGTYAVLV